jgi:hypothetical protein
MERQNLNKEEKPLMVTVPAPTTSPMADPIVIETIKDNKEEDKVEEPVVSLGPMPEEKEEEKPMISEPITSAEGTVMKIMNEPEDSMVPPRKEIIVEEEFIIKPRMPLLEEESMESSMDLIPIVSSSRKSRSSKKSKSVTKTQKKYKRCKKNHRRSKKTHRCNKNCPPGHKRNQKTKHCVKKGGKKN